MQTTLYAGETLSYRASVSGYPATDGWALTLVLGRRTGGAPITIASTPDGDAHLIQASATTTAAWAPAAYGWELWAAKGAERYRVEHGQLTVAPSLLGAAAGLDTRSDAERALDAVTALLAGKAAEGTEFLRVAGRELRSYPLLDLIRLQAKLRTEVNAERMAAGLQPLPGTGVRPILVRM